MKVSEYRQMMAYLTRPRFNGGGSVGNKTVLPKKKPEKEVKKRKLENFEKAKPALENPKEVKEMIDKPKRGLVDEPGSYAGAADIRAFLEKAKKGSTIDVAKFLDENAKTQAERNSLNKDFKRIVKEFKNKKLKLKFGAQGRKLSLEGKTGKIIKALQDLPKGSAINFDQLGKDLELGDDATSLIQKIIKNTALQEDLPAELDLSKVRLMNITVTGGLFDKINKILNSLQRIVKILFLN